MTKTMLTIDSDEIHYLIQGLDIAKSLSRPTGLLPDMNLHHVICKYLLKLKEMEDSL